MTRADSAQTDPVLPYGQTVEAIGWLSSHIATLAGAWDGDAPDWFPEPEEWLRLWNCALEETRPVAQREQWKRYVRENSTWPDDA